MLQLAGVHPVTLKKLLLIWLSIRKSDSILNVETSISQSSLWEDVRERKKEKERERERERERGVVPANPWH